MANPRQVEIFSAGCGVCESFVEAVREAACPSCDVRVLDMHDPHVAQLAAALGVQSLPAVAIDGALADCCTGRGPDLDTLRAAGLGRPL